MNLKSLRYGIQYDARYGARLTEKYCRGASFFCGARVHQKSTQGARNIVHQNFKFSELCSTSQPCLQIIFILSPYSNPMIFFSETEWFPIISHDP